MKKILLSCLTVLALGLSAQINLGGNSTSTALGGYPVDTYYGYTYSQQIFTKAEVNAIGAGSITGLKFYLSANATISNSNQWTVYVGHTTKATFTSGTDWIAANGLTEVYSGTVVKTGGEVTVTFNTPFPYNNTDNLVIAVDENASSYDGSSDRFYSYTGISNSTLYYTSDSTNPNPLSISLTGTRVGTKSRVTLLGLTPDVPPCPTISAPTANSTTVSVTPALTWAAASGASSYVVSLGTTSGGVDVIDNLNVGNVLTYSVPASVGLQYGTQYYLTVKAVNVSGQSTGCAERVFTTTTSLPCPTVSAPAAGATNISTLPTITWASQSGITGYRLSVGTTSGGTDVLNNVDLGNVNTYTFTTPLLNSTTYYYRLIPYSGSYSTTSCTVRSFTTACSSIVPPYTFPFTSTPWSCWSQLSGGTPASPGTGTSTVWVQDTFANVSGGNPAASFNIYGTNNTGFLISPTFDMSAGNYRVKFNYAFKMYNSQNVVTSMGSDDNVQFLMSTNGGTTWQSMKTWDASTGTYPDASTEFIYELPTVTGSNVKFALYATSGATNNSLDYEFFVDDFKIESIPSCAEPTSVTFTSVTANTATVNWLAPSVVPANGYVVYYSTTNTAPTSSTVLDATNSVTSNTATADINGLTSNTIYYVWVKSVCSATLSSNWSSMGTFTTLCSSQNIPYSEGFTSVTTPAIPTCTSIQNAGNGNNWITYGSAGGGFVGNVLNYSYNSSQAANAWFFTPGLNLTAGVTYRISYKYGNASGTSYPEKMKVAMGASPNFADMNTLLADHGNIVNGNTPLTNEYDFTVPTTGVYYFGFNAYSAANMNRLYLDDILVDLAPTCFPPTALTVGTVSSDSAEVSWTAPSLGVPQTYDIYYSTTNVAPTATSVPQITGVTGTSHIIPGLSPYTMYYVWVRTSCSSSDQSVWSQGSQFFTLCQPPVITSTTPATVCPNNTAVLSVAGDSNAVFNWYDAATGGTILGNGSSFTTPVLSSTTDYWVSAATYNTTNGGKLTPTATDGNTGYSDVGLMFDAYNAFKLKSVDVYPRGTAGSVVNATVQVKDASGTVVQSKVVPVTVPVQTPMTAQTLSLDFDIPAGNNYRLVFSGITPTTGLTAMIRESSTSNFTYPYNIASVASIKSAYTSGASNSYYYYFYNWQIETVCESARQQVTATVSSSGCLGTSEVSVNNNVKVYPNPFKDVINIVGYENYVSGMVMDASGKVVKVLDKVESTLNLSGLGTGMYILNLNNKKGDKVSVKIMKN